ncbi:MAG: ABATE domain-containing protein [Minwuiales bacterium]|nr:ABATE domain-containing protein [Minwuiales bacterium]
MADQDRRWSDRNFIGGDVSLDFANTAAGRTDGAPLTDGIRTYADLVAWSRAAGLLSATEVLRLGDLADRQPDEAAATLDRAIRLREAVFAVFAATAAGRTPREDAIADLNDSLADALPNLKLAHAGNGFAWSWRDDNGALDRMLWPIARAAAALLTECDPTRIRCCPGDDCGWLFVDLSRNGRRRWCDMRICGNRNKAKRHYRKSRAVG